MRNKIFTALISVVLAFCLWLYVITVVSPNSDKTFTNIPVTLQSEVILQERGLMIVTADLPEVTLQLEGNRTDLDKLNSANITIAVDVSRIGTPGKHSLSYTPSFPGDIANNAITVLSRSPDHIIIEVENRISKSVPVDIQYNGTLSEDYMADKDNKVLDYEEINITGPESVIDQIAMARIEVDMNNRVESINEQFEYTLCNEKGEPVDAAMVVTDAEAVTLNLRIVRVKQLELVVNVIDGGGATEDTSSITIEPQTIRVSGSDNLLEGLEKLELGTINLGEMLADEVLTFPIKLPEGVNNETGVMEATVDVKFPELDTKTLTVKEFTAVNVPAGLQADIITQMLEIQLRGPKTSIKNITEENITVEVDFAGEAVGTVKVAAKVIVDIEGVGMVGTYNVTATLRKA